MLAVVVVHDALAAEGQQTLLAAVLDPSTDGFVVIASGYTSIGGFLGIFGRISQHKSQQAKGFKVKQLIIN